MLKHSNELFRNINNTYGAHTATNSTFYNSGKNEVPSNNDIYRDFVKLLKQRREMKQRLDISKINLENEMSIFTSSLARFNLITEIHLALFNTTDMSVGKCQYYTQNNEMDVLPTDCDGDSLVLNSKIALKPEYIFTTQRNLNKGKYYFGHQEQLQPYPRPLSI